MKQAKSLDFLQLKKFDEAYTKNRALHITANALSRQPISDITFVQSSLANQRFAFSIDIPTLPATNQQNSGRCWIFAALNVLRERIAKSCNLETFELSQNYLAFWDKIEKINFILESIIDRIDEAPDERTLCWILDTGIQDGGQWDMIVSLIEKYGIVPKNAMPESYQSGHTPEMNALINRKLRQSAAKLQSLWNDSRDISVLHTAKETILSEMYSFCCANLGTPPQNFDFEYVDKDKNYHADRHLTPQSFYEKYIGKNILDDYVSIIHAPTADKPFYQTYTVDYIGNVVGGRPVHYLNLPMEDMISLILTQLNDNEVVWFGSDVGHYRDRKNGVWDDRAYDYELAFDTDFHMTKGEMLRYRHSAMTHAMVITGVNLDENQQPDRWKIQNSWGDKIGDKGYYLMSQSWFSQYVYQAVIHKKHLSSEQTALLEMPPVHLDPWDPMGTLALCN